MVRRMSASEIKAKLLAVLHEVADGDEVEITKHGRTVARLVPAAGSHALKGSFAGVATTAVEHGFTLGSKDGRLRRHSAIAVW